MEVMQSTTAESPPDQNVVVEQQSNDVALAMQCEVRLIMLVQLIAHRFAIIPRRVPP
jgi:hypothetical protein